MKDDQKMKHLDWHLPENAKKAEHHKLVQTFHEQEVAFNKNRLLYPPDEVGPVSQLNYSNERRE
jgi:hypothetical protein